MRTIVKIYSYACDAQAYDYSCDSTEDVTRGDAIPKYEGAIFPDLAGKVHSVDDADKVMKLRHRWYITKHVHLCPDHHPESDR